MITDADGWVPALRLVSIVDPSEVLYICFTPGHAVEKLMTAAERRIPPVYAWELVDIHIPDRDNATTLWSDVREIGGFFAIPMPPGGTERPHSGKGETHD